MYILGASTLGRMVLDVALDLGLDIEGFVDDITAARDCAGVAVVGGTQWLTSLAARRRDVAAFVAVGDNDNRANLTNLLLKAGIQLPSLVHPRACVARSAVLGAGNLVMASASIGTSVCLGDGNVILHGVCFVHDNRIGNFNFFAPGVSVGGRTAVGDRCKLGMHVAVMHDLSLSSGSYFPPATVVS